MYFVFIYVFLYLCIDLCIYVYIFVFIYVYLYSCNYELFEIMYRWIVEVTLLVPSYVPVPGTVAAPVDVTVHCCWD